MGDEAQLRDYLKRATVELAQERRRLHAHRYEPIAIVGMACRYPGGAGSPEQLWRLVEAGEDAISDLPGDRGWDLGSLPDALPAAAARGGFISAAGEFDAGFFGISPREALASDPQQRLLLETAWEALEAAGLDPAALRGSATGVFVGVSLTDYIAGLTDPSTRLDGYRLFSAAPSIVSGRVAYALGLEGPTLTVDTACSSSLVSLHLAAQALRAGECSLALAGGVTVLSTPLLFHEFAQQGGLASDGRCKAFADAADGTAFGEGAGVLALERLADAERNGHRVLAVIRGSALNQDGASNGLTAPNGPSQERVIRQALESARLQAAEVDAVEAHGTGTTLGDPIEAGALLATYGQDRETPLKLGSIKSNIGHTQAAAGVAGVIKMTMAMREGVLPKTLHVDAPSQKVDWEAGRIELLSENAEWQADGRPRRAGISAFGMSGTNAHLILEQAPVADGEAEAERGSLPGPLPLVLSAKAPEALREQAARLGAQLEASPELELADLSFSLATTRAAMEERAVVVGEGREQLLDGLAALAAGRRSASVEVATARPGALVYLFTGQGSQRPGMGRELYETWPAYREALDAACAELDRRLERPLRELLFCEPGSAEAALLDRTAYAQPALFATETALHRLLESLGLRPDLLTGHSVGGIVAAHVAGVLDLANAAELICARGALMEALPAGGAMLAIEAGEEEARASIEDCGERLALAAVNGPSACVLSGAEQAIAELEAHWRNEGRKAKRLAVSHAFHSPLIEPMLDDFAAVLAGLDLGPPQLPVVSELSGELLSAEQAGDPAYWVAHARQPVRFADAVATLRERGASAYLELGPDAVLSAMAASCLGEGAGQRPIPTMRTGRAEPQSLILALAAAHAAGARVDWDAFFAGSAARAVPLPTYPFQRRRYWLEPSAGASDPSAIGQAATGHPFLGATIEGPEGEGPVLTGRISLDSHPWLADHATGQAVLLPGAALAEMALRAGREVGCEALEELALPAPLLLPETGGVAVQVRVGAAGERGERAISIHSRADRDGREPPAWTCNARGVLSAAIPLAAEPLEQWPPADAEPLQLEAVYDRIAAMGFQYGPAFQGMTAAWRLGDSIYLEVSLAPGQAAEAPRFLTHPALLDAALQGGFLAAIAAEDAGEERKPILPFAWTGVQLGGAGETSLRARLQVGEEETLSLDAFDLEGRPLLAVGAVIGRAVSTEQLAPQGDAHAGLMRVEWSEVSPEAAPEEPSPVEAIALPGADHEGDVAAAAHAAARAALELVQARVLEAGVGPRTALITEGALAVAPGDRPDPAAAAVWGLMRSALFEHPDRFALIDTDGAEASRQALPAALAAGAEEPQLALREGVLFAPRVIHRAAVEAAAGEPAIAVDPERTVLVSGATGGLGSLLCRHLVEAHGARRLLLVSRSGIEADGAAELAERLAELGAEARIESCDVADRERLAELIDSIDPDHPLGAVVHAAGAIDDSLLEAMSREQLDRVLAAKLDGAWHLHELTADLDLSTFAMFSSMAGTVGGPGQGNYAAANVFLDSLAALRAADGLPGVSIAWGLWERESGITAGMNEADRERIGRLGVEALSDKQGLELFDAALGAGEPLLLAARLHPGSLGRIAMLGALPPILSGLIRRTDRRQAPELSLAERLAELPEAEHGAAVLELVREEVAAVLGHASADAVAPQRTFAELGLDSLAALEMRNRLGALAQMPMPITLVFDYPTAAALAEFLLSEAHPEPGKDA
jgi:acyl transferase domain-containing protein/acyl carrier protein